MLINKITALMKRSSAYLLIGMLCAGSLTSTYAQKYYLIRVKYGGKLWAISSQITLGDMYHAFQKQGYARVFYFVTNRHKFQVYDANNLPDWQTLSETLKKNHATLFSFKDLKEIDKIKLHIKTDRRTQFFKLTSEKKVAQETLLALNDLKSQTLLTKKSNSYLFHSINEDVTPAPLAMPALPLTPGNASLALEDPMPKKPLPPLPHSTANQAAPQLDTPPPITSSTHAETPKMNFSSAPMPIPSAPSQSLDTHFSNPSIHYPTLSRTGNNTDTSQPTSPVPPQKLATPPPMELPVKEKKDPPPSIDVAPTPKKVAQPKITPPPPIAEPPSEEMEAINELGRVIRNEKPAMSTPEKIIGTTVVGTIALLITSVFFNREKSPEPKKKETKEKPTQLMPSSPLRNTADPVHSDSLQKAAQK